MNVGVIIPAAGSGRRMRGGGGDAEANLPKQFLTLKRLPILVRTMAPFLALRAVRQVRVALPAAQADFLDRYIRRYGWAGRVRTVPGGATRQASVAAAYAELDQTLDVVLVHDGVRPFVDAPLIRRVMRAAHRVGAAVPALPPTDTLKRAGAARRIIETLPRAELYCAQTPQGFRTPLLGAALAQARRDGFEGTDEASLVERLGQPVHWVPGSVWNFKVTRPMDLLLARTLARHGVGTLSLRTPRALR